MYKIRLVSIIFFLSVSASVFSQIKYPVTVSGFRVRPGIFLDDYTLAGTRNMSAAIVFNDLAETDGRRVFLRFFIESAAIRIQARQGWIPRETLTIYPGDVVSLNDDDFFPWFNNDVWALQGISRKDLEKNG
jgi:hypothetical protein